MVKISVDLYRKYIETPKRNGPKKGNKKTNPNPQKRALYT